VCGRAGSDNEIRVWDILAGGRMIRSVSNHQKAITTLAFNVRSAVCVCARARACACVSSLVSRLLCC
jgi:WD40 repeat protein